MPTILRPNNDNDPANWQYDTGDTPTFSGVAAGSYQVGHVEWSTAQTVTADATAPTLSSPTGAADGSTACTGTVSTTEAGGTLYFAAYPGAGAEPSSEQIIAGTGGGIVSADSQAVSATGVQNVARSGLTAGTDYKVAYVQVDGAVTPNTSAVVSSAQFTTAAAAVDLLGGAGAFDATGSWVLGVNNAITGGVLQMTSVASPSYHPITVVQGTSYTIQFTMSDSNDAGSIRFRFTDASDGNGVTTAHQSAANGTRSVTLTPGAGTARFYIVLGASLTAKVDNITVVETP